MDRPLPEDHGVVLEMYGNEQFSRDVVQRFGHLCDELEENADLLHVQMGALARVVRSAISSDDTELPLQICAFLNEALENPRAISEIETAVAMSFVEAYELRESAAGRTAFKLMPQRVREILLDQEKRGDAQ